MDLLQVSFRVFDEILKENAGVKVILTDEDTMPILGVSITRTETLLHEVLLISKISQLEEISATKTMSSLQCIAILRPTLENARLLANELSNLPHFGKYTLVFTNSVESSVLAQLAKADRFNLVEKVDEIFIDYRPLFSRLFSLNISSTAEFREGRSNYPLIEMISKQLFAVITSLALSPTIRFESSSAVCSDIADSLQKLVLSNNISVNTDSATVFIIDRASDLLTPLMHSWYYLPAVHDMFNIKDNVFHLPGASEPSVLMARTDAFLREYGTKFLSEVGPAVIRELDEAKALGQVAKQTISDPDQMPKVVDATVKFQNKIAAAKEHVNIVEALNTTVTKKNLLVISELEQSIAVSNDIATHSSELISLAGDEKIEDTDLLRLALIYTLRYATSASPLVSEVRAAIQARCGTSAIDKMDVLARLNKGKEMVSTGTGIKRFIKDIKVLYEANQNLLTQYTPFLSTLLENFKSGNLSDQLYPRLTKNEAPLCKKVIVFYVGGVTLDEMRVACEMSKSGLDVIVGGTDLINARSFIEIELINN